VQRLSFPAPERENAEIKERDAVISDKCAAVEGERRDGA
jgi:hypothetical protein